MVFSSVYLQDNLMSQIDDIAGKGWDYKPADTKEESPGFLYS